MTMAILGDDIVRERFRHQEQLLKAEDWRKIGNL